MMQPNFNWPKKGDRAFKPSLSPADKGRLEAFVMPSDGTYVVGFQRAADMIVDAAQSDDLNPDDLFFPVAYLYRHHLELMLKELVRLGIRIGAIQTSADCPAQPCPCCGHIAKAPKDALLEHNLLRLWNSAKDLIKQVWPDSPYSELKFVEHVILEFHKIDPSGQAFRFARDKNGALHLQNAPKCVDLANLKARMNAVSSFLDAAYAGIDNCDPGPP